MYKVVQTIMISSLWAT